MWTDTLKGVPVLTLRTVLRKTGGKILAKQLSIPDDSKLLRVGGSCAWIEAFGSSL